MLMRRSTQIVSVYLQQFRPNFHFLNTRRSKKSQKNSLKPSVLGFTLVILVAAHTEDFVILKRFWAR